MKKIVILFLALVLINPPYFKRAEAAARFSANFDDGFNAQTAAGDAVAYTDGVWPTLETRYGGNGQAIRNTLGSTIKYRTNNFNQQNDSISFNFQLPYDLNGDQSKGKIGEGYSYIAYDSIHDYIYVADVAGEQVIRTKMDGSDWQVFGSYGSGEGQFNFGGQGDIAVDSLTQEIYVSDTDNNRIVKFKMDGSEWQTFGTSGSGVGQFGDYSPREMAYDQVSGFLFIYDIVNSRIVKTKFGGEGWQSLDISGLGITIGGLAYDSSSGYIYFSDPGNNAIGRIKIDGSGYSTYGTKGGGTGNFDMPYGIAFSNDFIYVVDENNHRIVKTKMDGSGWQSYGSQGVGAGKFWDPYTLAVNSETQDIYVIDTLARAQNNFALIKTKIDGSSWSGYASQGLGSVNNHYTLDYNATTGDYYFAAYTDQILKTKKDGSDWQLLGHQGDGSPGTFSYLTGIAYDKSTDYVYALDHYINGVIRTKMDGTGWEVYKGPGGNNFSTPRGLAYDQNTGFLFVGAMKNGQIVKTKFDGTGWITYGSPGSGVGQFDNPMIVRYDALTHYIYVSDMGNSRLVRFKMDGGDPGWQELDTSSWYSYGGPNFAIESGTDYVYITTEGGQIVRVKMDGTGASTLDTSTWTSYSDTYFYPEYYDTVTNHLISTDGRKMYVSEADGTLIESFTAIPDKVLFKTSGANPLEMGVSAYNGKFNLTLNKYSLPVSYSQSQTMTGGSWHQMLVKFNRSNGTMQAFLDGDASPLISAGNLSFGSDMGDYIYIGSDPDNMNRNFSGLIDNLRFEFADVPASSVNIAILPETGMAN